MGVASRAGRAVGVLIIAQMAGAFLVNFTLTKPLFGAPGFLVAAAPHATQLAVSVLLGLAIGALPLAMAITAFPVFRRSADALAIWFVALSVVSFSAAVVEQSNVMSMLSLSQAYTEATDQGPFSALRIVVASSRNWSHFIGLLVHGSTSFVLYLVLFRSRLVPRWLAAFGLAAVLLQLVAVAMPLFGREVVFPLLAPVGLSQLALALWLIARGFPEAASPAAAKRPA
ncbi:MAG TPA: DUF4386 domain-containing protein [Myxococcales bacterium]|nr:DUF4386 domain-containing protein [Myxococcales bacterium]